MALHYHNPNDLFNQQHIFNSFEYQTCHFQDTNDIFEDDVLCTELPFLNDILNPTPPLETELLCFDDPLPPTLFHFDDPLFEPLPLQPFDHFEHVDYNTQFISFPKKQKVEFSYPSFIQETFDVPKFNEFTLNTAILTKEEQFNPFNDHFHNGCLTEFNEGYGENVNDDTKAKVKVISAQSRAAKERRRKIAMKTNELGKLIPGGTKLNTAEMFQAAASYVKFMKAQLGILQAIETLHKDDDGNEEANINNLPILSSKIVQEKLFAKEMCLVQLDFLPLLEEHCDTETKASISQHITKSSSPIMC